MNGRGVGKYPIVPPVHVTPGWYEHDDPLAFFTLENDFVDPRWNVVVRGVDVRGAVWPVVLQAIERWVLGAGIEHGPAGIEEFP